MAAMGQVYPRTLHKLCLYRTTENIGAHGDGLGPGVLSTVRGKFRAAASTQTESVSDITPREASWDANMHIRLLLEYRGTWPLFSWVTPEIV